MKIVILTGSPHHPGTSESLADAFEKGAKEAGNEVYRFDAGRRSSEFSMIKLEDNISGMEREILPDDIVENEVIPKVIESDLVVFVSSLYYYGINSPLKALIDRFYTYNHELHGNNSYQDSSHGNRKVITLVTGYDSDPSFASLDLYFKQYFNYMRWDWIDKIIASDSWNSDKLKKHQEQAYALGKQIR